MRPSSRAGTRGDVCHRLSLLGTAVSVWVHGLVHCASNLLLGLGAEVRTGTEGGRVWPLWEGSRPECLGQWAGP